MNLILGNLRTFKHDSVSQQFLTICYNKCQSIQIPFHFIYLL